MDFTLVAGAASAISTAIGIGKTAVDIRDANKLSGAVIAMNEQLLNAQQSLFVHNASLMELQQKYFEATQELREVKETLAERQRYSLFEITPGFFVYRVNVDPSQSGSGTPGSAEPEHYVCQPCLDGPTKSRYVLRYYSGTDFGTYWHCPGCKSDINVRN